MTRIQQILIIVLLWLPISLFAIDIDPNFNDPIDLNVIAPTLDFCEGTFYDLGNITFTDNSVSPPIPFTSADGTWTETNTGTVINNLNIEVQEGPIQYTFALNDPTCPGSAIVVVNGFPLPDITIVEPLISLCETGSVELDLNSVVLDLGPLAEGGFLWYEGITSNIVNLIPTSNYIQNPVDGDQYYVEFTTVDGCVQGDILTVSIGAPPTPTSNVTSPVQCSSAITPITISGQAGSTFTWYDITGTPTTENISGTNNEIFTPPGVGSYFYGFSQTIGNCESGQGNFALEVIDPLETPEPFCSIESINSVQISWPAIEGASSYDVEYTINSGGVAIDNFTSLMATFNLMAGDTVTATVTANGVGGPADPCGSSAESIEIICNALDCPDPTYMITGIPTQVCESDDPYVLTTDDPSSSGSFFVEALLDADGLFDPNSYGGQTVNISYIYTDAASGCELTVDLEVEVLESLPIPSNPTCVNQLANSIEVAWDAVIGANSYEIEYFTTDINQTTTVIVTEPTYSLTGLTSGETATFYITAIGAGNCGISLPVTLNCNTGGCATDPNPFNISNLGFSVCEDTGNISLETNNPNGGGTFGGPGVTGNVFNPSGLAPQIITLTYDYIDSGSCPQSAEYSLLVESPLQAPTLVCGNSTMSLVEVTWNNVAGATSYDIEYTVNSGTPQNVNDYGTNNYVVTGLNGGDIVSIFVSANGDGACAMGPASMSIDCPAMACSADPIIITGVEEMVCENFAGLLGNDDAVPLGMFSGPGVSGTFFSGNGLGGQTITISYQDTDEMGCPQSGTFEVQVEAELAEPVINCIDSDFSSISIDWNDVTGAEDYVVEYSINNSASQSITVTNSDYVLINLSAGDLVDFTVTATGMGLCGDSDESDEVQCSTTGCTIDPNPAMIVNLTSDYCSNNPAVNLLTNGPIGTFSGPGVSGDVFNPSLAGLGDKTIIYSYTDDNNCPQESSITVSITEPVSAPILFCGNVSTNSVTVTWDPIPNVTAYTLSYTIESGVLMSEMVSGTSFELMGLSPNDVVELELVAIGNGVCGDSETSPMITCTAEGCQIGSSPYSIVNLESEYCSVAGAFVLETDEPDGDGVFTGEGVTGNIFDPSQTAPGTVFITYSYEDESACPQVVESLTLITEPIPVPVVICGNSTTNSISINWEVIPGAANYTVSYSINGDPNIEALSVVNQFTVSNLNPGDEVLIAVQANGENICNDSSEFSVEVNCIAQDCITTDNPYTITGLEDSYCINNGGIILMTDDPDNDGVFGGPGVIANIFDPAGLSGEVTLTYTYEDENNCPQVGTFTLMVDEPIAIPEPFCVESTLNSVLIDWDPIEGSNGNYFVFYSINGAPYIEQSGASTSAFFNLGDLAPGDSVSFYMYADDFDVCGDSELSDTIICIASDCPTELNPFTITNLPTEICSTDNIISLETDDPDNDGTFDGDGIAVFDGNSVFNPAIVDVGPVTLTYSYIDENDCSQIGEFTTTVIDPLGIPELTCEDASTNSVTISWLEIEGADDYTITYSVNSGTDITEQTTELLFEATGLSSQDNVEFTVIANGLGVCGNSEASLSVTCSTEGCTIDDTPFEIISLNANYCSTSGPITLTTDDPTESGTFSGEGVTGTTFNPATLAGNIDLFYDYEDENGCPQQSSIEVIVEEPLETPNPICDVSSTTSVSISWEEITNADNYTITYEIDSEGEMSEDTDGTTFELTMLNAGASVVFQVTANSSSICGNSDISDSITCMAEDCSPSANPFVIVLTETAFCSTADAITLTTDDPTESGIFSGEGVTGTEFNPVTLAGNIDLFYDYEDENGCPQQSSIQISVVEPLENPVLVCGNTTTTSVAISWNDIPENEGYAISYQINTGDIENDMITSNEYELIDLTSGDEVTFFVNAVGGTVCGDSEMIEITCLTQNCETAINPFVINNVPTEVCTNSADINLESDDPENDGTFTGEGIENGVFSPASLIPGTYDLSYTYEDEDNCLQTGSISITVLDVPSLEIDGNTTICQNGSIILNEIGGEATSWTWTGPNDFESFEQEITIENVNNTNAGLYFLSIEDENGCVANTDAEIIVQSLPTVSIESNAPVCAGQTLELMEIGGEGTSWTWSGPDNFTSEEQNPSIENVSLINEGVYTVIVTDGNDCVREDQINISLIEGVELMIQPTGPFCVNEDLQQLFANPPGENWNGEVNADGTFDPSMGAGTYEVIYESADDGPCSSSDTIYIEVFDIPEIDAGIGGIINCTDTEILLEGTAIGNDLEIEWTGPEIISGASSLNPMVGSAGTYYLSVTNSNTNCSIVDSVEVTQDDEVPVAVITGGGTIDCTGNNSFVLSAEGSTAMATTEYIWSTGDGMIEAGEETLFEINVSQPGTYVLTVTNISNNCEAVANVTIEEDNDLPNIEVVTEVSIACGMTEVVLSGSSTTANVIYEWTTEDGSIVVGANTPTPTVDAAGVYTLTVTAENLCTDFADVTVTANDAIPDISIVEPDSLTCGNLEVNLLLEVPDGLNLSYEWTTDNGIISAGANSQTPSVSAVGEYLVTVTNLENNCVATASIAVGENIEPPIFDVGDNQVICEGQAATLSADGAASFVWNPGNLMGASVEVSPEETTTYTLTATNLNNNCTEEAEITITVSEAPDAGSGGDAGSICNDSLEGESEIFLESLVELGGVWEALDGGPSVDINQFVNSDGFESLGLFNYAYIVSGTTPCNNDTAYWTITVEDCVTECINPPTVETGESQTVCELDLVNLSGTIGGGASSAIWSSNGDGIFTDENSLQTEYELGSNDIANGTVTLSLMTDDPDGADPLCNSAIDNLVITIVPFAFAGEDADGGAICNDNNEGISSTTLLTDGESGGSWEALDGGPAIEANGFVEANDFANLGTFNYQYIVIGETPCNNDTALWTLTIEDCQTDCDNPTTAEAGMDLTICETESIILEGIVNINPTNAFWTSNGDGVFPPDNTANATYVFGPTDIANGSVTLTLETQDSDGNGPCEAATDDLIITINSNVNAGEDQTLTLCNNLDEGIASQDLDDLLTTAETGAWISLSGESIDADNVFDAEGLAENTIVSLAYVVTGTAPCANDTADITITVLDCASCINPPIADFEYPNLGIFCSNDGSFVSPTFINGGTVGLFTAIPTELSIDPITGSIDLASSAQGIYTVTNTIPAMEDCPEVTYSYTVTISEAPIAITSNSGPYCIGEAIELFADGVEGATYSWTGPNNYSSNEQNPTDATEAGDYFFSIDLNTCASELAIEVVEFYEEGSVALSAVGATSICQGENLDLELTTIGTGPFEVVYFNGLINVTATEVNNGEVINITPTQDGNYQLVSATDGNDCTAEVTIDPINITVQNAPSFTNLIETCDNTGATYTVSFEVLSDDIGTVQIQPAAAGTLADNVFTSNPITNGAAYNFLITDSFNCGEITVEGAFDCGCVSNAGTMGQNLIELCEDEQYSVNASTDFTFDADDTGMYILHDNAGIEAGTIYAISTEGGPFVAENISGEFGETFYISFVVGNEDENNEVDLSDPCLSVAQGTPIIFYEDPEPDAGANDFVCGLSTELNASEPTGIGIFTLGTGPGNLNFINPNDPNTTIIADAYGSYEIIWSDQNGNCLGGDIVEIEFIPPPLIAVANYLYCGNLEATIDDVDVLFLNGNETGDFEIYSDNVGTPDLANGPITTITTVGVYWLLYDDNGCQTEASFEVIEDCACPTTVLTELTETVNICDGAEINLQTIQETVTTDFDGTAVYNWYFEGSLIEDLVFNDPLNNNGNDCTPNTNVYTLEISCESDSDLALDGGAYTVISYPQITEDNWSTSNEECVVELIDNCTIGSLEFQYSTDGGTTYNAIPPPMLEPGEASLNIDFIAIISGQPDDCPVYEGDYTVDCSAPACPTEAIGFIGASGDGCSGTEVDISALLISVTTNEPNTTVFNWVNEAGEVVSDNPIYTFLHSGGANCEPEVIILNAVATCTNDTSIALDAGSITYTVYPEVSYDFVQLPLGCSASITDLCESGNMLIEYSTDNGTTFTTTAPNDLEPGDPSIEVLYNISIDNGQNCGELDGMYPVICPDNCPTSINVPLGLETPVCAGEIVDLQSIAFNVETDLPAAAVYNWFDSDGNIVNNPAAVMLEHSGEDCVLEEVVYSLIISCNVNPAFSIEGGTATYFVYPTVINEAWFSIPNENCQSEIIVNCPNDNLNIVYSVDFGATFTTEPPVIETSALATNVTYSITLEDDDNLLCADLQGTYPVSCLEACPTEVFNPLAAMEFVCADSPNMIDFTAYEALVTTDVQEETVYNWVDVDGAVIDPTLVEFFHTGGICEPDTVSLFLQVDCNSDFELNLEGGVIDIIIYPEPNTDWVTIPTGCESEIQDLCGNLLINYSIDGETSFSMIPPELIAGDTIEIDYQIGFPNSPVSCLLTGDFTAECPSDCPTIVVNEQAISQIICSGESIFLGLEDVFFTDIEDQEIWLLTDEDGNEIVQDTNLEFVHSGAACVPDTIVLEFEVDCLTDANLDLFGGTWTIVIYPEEVETFFEEPIGCQTNLSTVCSEALLQDFLLIEYSVDGGNTYTTDVPPNLNPDEPDLEVFYQVTSTQGINCVDFSGNYTATCAAVSDCPTEVLGQYVENTNVCDGESFTFNFDGIEFTDAPEFETWAIIAPNGQSYDENDEFLFVHSGNSCEIETVLFTIEINCETDNTLDLFGGTWTFAILPNLSEFITEPEGCNTTVNFDCLGSVGSVEYSIDGGLTFTNDPPPPLELGDPDLTINYQVQGNGSYVNCPLESTAYTVSCPQGCPSAVFNFVEDSVMDCVSSFVTLSDFEIPTTDVPGSTEWIWTDEAGDPIGANGLTFEHSGNSCAIESFVANLIAICPSDENVQLQAGTITIQLYPEPDTSWVEQIEYCETVLSDNCTEGGLEFLYSIDSGVTYTTEAPPALLAGEEAITVLYSATIEGAPPGCPTISGQYNVACPEGICFEFSTSTPEDSLCSGFSQLFLTQFAQPIGVNGFWSIVGTPSGDNPATIDENLFVTMDSDPGLYTIRFTPTEPTPLGCPTFSDEPLYVALLPQVGEGSSMTFCENDAEVVNLIDLLSGDFQQGEWSVLSGDVLPNNFDPINATFSLNGQGEGEYTFAYTVDGLGNCDPQSSTVEVVIQGQTPIIAFQSDTTLCSTLPQELIFDLNEMVDSANFSYTLEALNNVDIQEGNIVDFNALSTGVYNFAIVLDDGCNEEAYPFQITKEECVNRLALPTAFTPNGDGLNDLFRPISENVDQVDFRIYDRWGLLVFETNDPTQGWDGYYELEPSEVGVYMFYLIATFNDGTSEALQGNVTLIR